MPARFHGGETIPIVRQLQRCTVLCSATSLASHNLPQSGNSPMDWVPVVFVTFKVLVFGTCMFYAIKWHYDQDKKKKQEREDRGQ